MGSPPPTRGSGCRVAAEGDTDPGRALLYQKLLLEKKGRAPPPRRCPPTPPLPTYGQVRL